MLLSTVGTGTGTGSVCAGAKASIEWTRAYNNGFVILKLRHSRYAHMTPDIWTS